MTHHHRALIVGCCLGLAACGTDAVDTGPSDGLEQLDARRQLIRLSVDLRGVHPTETELLTIEQSPELYDQYVERYLDDARFDARLREAWNLRFLTRNGETYFDPAEAGLAGISDAAVADALADEPLRMVSRIYWEDLSYAELVTADHTMGNLVVGAMWGLTPTDGVSWADDPDWRPATYDDGRPHAGLLTMTTTWQRYPSMGGNANRHRANAVSKLLLCDDYLSRPIVLNRTAVEELTEDPEDAISSNTGCQSCHSTLDPLAAHFYGFFHYDAVDGLRDATLYRPENEEGWRDYADKSPGYYGRPTANLVELGQQIAEDPAFVDCAVKTAFQGFTQRDADLDADWAELQEFRDVFVANDMRLRPLVQAIVTSRAYTAGATDDPDLDERLATVRTASPLQLASIIHGITGYTWTFDGRDGLVGNVDELAVLEGGVGGAYVVQPSYEPGVSAAYVQERLAWSAAWDVVSHDLDSDRQGDARMLSFVTIDDLPETAERAFDTQIRDLYLQVTGLPLDSDATQPAALIEVWKQVYSVEGTPTAAWAAVLAAVLRDPQVLFY